MALELQNPIQDFFQGKAREMPVGYQKLHTTWLARNPNYYTLSIPEQIESFTQYIGAVVSDRLGELIERMDIKEEEKRTLRRLAKRDQLILASKDGKHFDQVIKPEDAKKIDPKEYSFLSTSLLSQTKSFTEVLDIQVAKHVIHTLKNSGFEFDSIDGVTLKTDGRIEIELDNNPKIAQIQVDLRQPVDKALDYVHIAPTGERKHVTETQLPEEHGELKVDPTLEVQTDEEIMLAQLGMGKMQVDQATGAAMAAGTAADALNRVNIVNRASAFQQAQALLAGAQTPMPEQEILRSINLPTGANIEPTKLANVQASKANVNRKNEEFALSQKSEQERYAQAEKENQQKEQQLAAQKSQPAPQAPKKGIGTGMKWLAGATGAAGAAGLGTGSILYLNLFT